MESPGNKRQTTRTRIAEQQTSGRVSLYGPALFYCPEKYSLENLTDRSAAERKRGTLDRLVGGPVCANLITFVGFGELQACPPQLSDLGQSESNGLPAHINLHR